ncbi:hypothetical protein M3Y97_01095100 [Aphelenchoides bicaudatus]|nr:hypothetical protein M3Y97_01095100 [Aphelenchoides bicaudatus]
MGLYIVAAFLAVIFSSSNAKNIQIHLRENVTMKCPNVNSDVVDQKSFKFTFHELPAEGHSLTNDQLVLTDSNGRKTSLRFPGCYRIKLEFRLNRPLKNPYIETFMRMGTNLPCQLDSTANIEQNSHSLCTNISRPADWCPESRNKQLRTMLRDKSTCRFCNLCEKAKQSSQTEQHFISTDSTKNNQQCKTDKLRQSVEFKVCTPDRKSMHKMNEDNDGKFDEYWQYLKQASQI